jgi:hypothetical protein
MVNGVGSEDAGSAFCACTAEIVPNTMAHSMLKVFSFMSSNLLSVSIRGKKEFRSYRKQKSSTSAGKYKKSLQNQ